eukprot:TRINITY_DN5823_c0_g1_i1.p1 TRINITY_DN5823_c0_g1~~TRINITY_DN5823_c0_g1_i1.p1  ORF type:complete len:245 (-),score=30.09 TRINITY_DN5823_c0_g1_i1:470-1204(-)
MSCFIPSTSNTPNFEDCILILPALSLGNVGQLTLDLLVPSLQIPHVGYIDDPCVLPCAGNDAYTKRGTGVLCSNLEIYHSEAKKLVLLQQRAPVATGRNKHFVSNIINWARESKFKYILLLLSSDAAYRTPTQMDGSPFRAVSVAADPVAEIPSLESESYSNTFKSGTVAENFVAACSAEQFPLRAVTMFCSEGDNIPDAIKMATQLDSLLELSDSKAGSPNWVLPSSWAALLRGNYVDRFLFG